MAAFGMIGIVLMVLFRYASLALFIWAIILLIRALLKYLRSGEVRKEKQAACSTLGEAIKENRVRCKMTQEFVAERLGVSRQAVSKWESGTSDPSTSNLLALAGLFGVPPEELLRTASHPNGSPE